MGLKDLKNKIMILGWKKSKDESVDRKPPAKPDEVKDQGKDKDGDQNKSREESTASNITEKMKGVSVNDHEDSSSGPSQEADGAPTYASQQHYQDQGLEWRRYWRHASSGDHNWQENMTNDIVNDFFKPPY
ncbi:hypothetical protein RHMOL_Rhmol04G0262000 [Rhododendron molle]|uniref:Uncharacterized protein n=1 Tax=Rhododendron molle TaxID=49168 RepID=A0ACC0P5Q4_RHOML|nr:hypothetical protein RHMOL_Rhmol04G0262000 [Rhododendron molle]